MRFTDKWSLHKWFLLISTRQNSISPFTAPLTHRAGQGREHVAPNWQALCTARQGVEYSKENECDKVRISLVHESNPRNLACLDLEMPIGNSKLLRLGPVLQIRNLKTGYGIDPIRSIWDLAYISS